MNQYTLIPTISYGNITFNSERSSVRSYFGKYKTFTKSKLSENTTDDFGFCHTFYDPSNRLIAIELFPETSLIFDNTDLLKLTAEELVNKIIIRDENADIDTFSILSRKLGICADIEDGLIKSILICTSDYYD